MTPSLRMGKPSASRVSKEVQEAVMLKSEAPCVLTVFPDCGPDIPEGCVKRAP